MLGLEGARDGCAAALQVSGVLIIAKGHASASELKRVIQRITSEQAIATPRLLLKLRLPPLPLLALDVRRSGVRKSKRRTGCAYALPYHDCLCLAARIERTNLWLRAASMTVGGAGQTGRGAASLAACSGRPRRLA